MESVKNLEAGNVPKIKNIYIHKDDVIGVTETDEIVILATLTGKRGNHAAEGKRNYSPRKKKPENNEVIQT